MLRQVKFQKTAFSWENKKAVYTNVHRSRFQWVPCSENFFSADPEHYFCAGERELLRFYKKWLRLLKWNDLKMSANSLLHIVKKNLNFNKKLYGWTRTNRSVGQSFRLLGSLGNFFRSDWFESSLTYVPYGVIWRIRILVSLIALF